jgi:large subunit ribosomal protein L30e
MAVTDEIRNALKNDKLIIGTDRVMKAIKEKTVAKVVLSNNVPADVKEDIERYAGISEIPVEAVDMPNEDLGVLCRKKFHISVLGLQ